MSLGGVSPNGCGKTLYQDAINKIKAKGILIVVAAGNSNDEAANFVPASCDGVMTVGATGPTGDRASYSNYSSQFKVDISAPGGDSGVYGSAYGILSTVNSGKNGPESSTYDYKNGTSMAAPHIAGIATLGLALDPEIAPELLQLSLLLTSQSFPATSQCTTMYPVCGVGIVSAYDSLQAVVALKPYSLIYEYKNINTGHYFRTNNAGESAFVLNGGAGDGWVDTKDYFLAWRDSSQGASPVCRFYSAGSNSHFFTADAGECALVKKNPDWNYEGIAYYVRQTNQGTCPVDTLPIYRAYNNRWMYKDGNHRFSTDLSAINELVAKNWIFEGIAMCAAGG
jgi:serine protease